MKAAHKRILVERLEALLAIGETEFHEQELRMWYDYQRISNRVWCDISEKWSEIWSEYEQTNFWNRPYPCERDFYVIHYGDKKIYKLISREIKKISEMV